MDAKTAAMTRMPPETHDGRGRKRPEVADDDVGAASEIVKWVFILISPRCAGRIFPSDNALRFNGAKLDTARRDVEHLEFQTFRRRQHQLLRQFFGWSL